MVFIVLALFGWSSYTFLGVILRRCWQRAPDALVGFVAGSPYLPLLVECTNMLIIISGIFSVVLTAIYGLLWIMFFVTYLKVGDL
jgi:hypothetical protein